MSKFKAGDKIRCINTDWVDPELIYIKPVYQGIYIVFEAFDEGVTLVEIPPVNNKIRQPFYNWHFEKSTEYNIEIMIVSNENLKIKQHQHN